MDILIFEFLKYFGIFSILTVLFIFLLDVPRIICEIKKLIKERDK